MMLQNVNIALSVVLCGCLLSGCNNSTTSASSSVSSPSTSDYESSSAATSNLDSYEDEEPTSAVPSSTQPPTEEPNTPDSSEPSASPAQPEQEYTDLSFLSEEQRQLYSPSFCSSNSDTGLSFVSTASDLPITLFHRREQLCHN